jgi:steroid delta-isomerase-like uncharacterized protein
MPDSTKELARRFFDRMNAGDLSAIDSLVSDDFVEHEEIPGMEPTKAGLRQMFEMIHSGLQDAKFEVDDLIAEGDTASARSMLTGTHRAEFMGIPATGRTISVGVSDYLRFDDGLLVEHWGVMDTGALMQQLTGGA